MRYLILTIITVVLALFVFLVMVVEDDKRWFQDFSKNQDESFFDYKLVNRIADLTLIEPPPPVISFTPVFATLESDSIAVTTFQNLRQIYLLEYQSQFQTFSRFLFEILNNKIKLNTEKQSVRFNCQSVFKIDTVINLLFQKEGIKGVLTRYLTARDSSYTIRNRNLSHDEYNSVSYYLFLNQLIRQEDDYHGTVYFKKLVLPQ